jgi:hypothetical protein
MVSAIIMIASVSSASRIALLVNQKFVFFDTKYFIIDYPSDDLDMLGSQYNQ